MMKNNRHLFKKKYPDVFRQRYQRLRQSRLFFVKKNPHLHYNI